MVVLTESEQEQNSQGNKSEFQLKIFMILQARHG